MRIGPIADADALGTKPESGMAVVQRATMAKQKASGRPPGLISATGQTAALVPGSPIHADQMTVAAVDFGVEAAAGVTANKPSSR